ncbi:EcsC family protein [Nocardioides campestrisoli]|uniref:EcsC family protein n=1 Tax=Nocardioides campestrisoli TaxID=2736757 RepID=UPI0015E6A0A5|nr:EcsC family protein [Nocardioides campestrisoli]
MGITSSVGKSVGKMVVPQVGRLAPGVTSRAVLEALARAIDGVGPLPPAARAAERQLAEQGGNVDRAIHEVIENNVRLAGAQGFATNIGGLLTMAVTLPANITGLAIIQSRMIAGIAHLRGYDLDDPKVRTAVLATLLGSDVVDELVKRRKIPGTPLALAAAPVHDPTLGVLLATEVAQVMLAKVAGKRLATAAGRRIPVVGGLVGASADGYTTWRAGRYTDKEFRPRARR